MAKKSKQSKRRKKVTAISSQFDKWMDLIGHQIFKGDYREAVTNCERLLNSLPMRASQRVDVWLNWELRRVCSRISRKATRLLVRRLLLIPMMPGCGSTGAWRAGSLYALGELCGTLSVLSN